MFDRVISGALVVVTFVCATIFGFVVMGWILGPVPGSAVDEPSLFTIVSKGTVNGERYVSHHVMCDTETGVEYIVFSVANTVAVTPRLGGDGCL